MKQNEGKTTSLGGCPCQCVGSCLFALFVMLKHMTCEGLFVLSHHDQNMLREHSEYGVISNVLSITRDFGGNTHTAACSCVRAVDFFLSKKVPRDIFIVNFFILLFSNLLITFGVSKITFYPFFPSVGNSTTCFQPTTQLEFSPFVFSFLPSFLFFDLSLLSTYTGTCL